MLVLRYFEALEVPEPLWGDRAALFLRGKAANWWASELARRASSKRPEWGEFDQKMSRRFAKRKKGTREKEERQNDGGTTGTGLRYVPPFRPSRQFSHQPVGYSLIQPDESDDTSQTDAGPQDTAEPMELGLIAARKGRLSRCLRCGSRQHLHRYCPGLQGSNIAGSRCQMPSRQPRKPEEGREGERSCERLAGGGFSGCGRLTWC